MERKGKYYVTAVLLGLWSCVSAYNWNQSIFGSPNYIEVLSKNEYLHSLFAGPAVLNREAIQLIRIPGTWLLFYLMLFYMNEKYFAEIFTGIQMQVILREKSMESWWDKKCLRILKYLILYYMSAWGTIWCVGKIMGGEGAVFRSVFVEAILPMLVSFSLCLVQGVFVLYRRAGLSLLAVIGYLLVSVYWERWYLLGNYCMLTRSMNIEKLMANGKTAGILAIVFSLAAWCIGRRHLKKMDL